MGAGKEFKTRIDVLKLRIKTAILQKIFNKLTKYYETFNLFGHVIDKQTGEHLPFVNVVVKGTTKGALTDESGHYFITNLTEGKHTLEVSYVGYVEDDCEITTSRMLFPILRA